MMLDHTETEILEWSRAWRVRGGDFIVPSTCGDLYPVDPETFWQLYELVE